jgi:hypothetical protein
MPALATDNFDRANNADLGASWTVIDGAMAILSNAATYTSSGSDAAEAYTAIEWPNDQYAQVAISSVGASAAESGIGVMLRCASATNYYRIVVDNQVSNNITVAKIVSGAYSVITSRTQAWTSGDILKVEVQSNTLRVYRNGVQLGADITGDATLTAGDVGLFYSSTGTPGINVNNFEGGDFAATSIPIRSQFLDFDYSR